MTNLPNTYQEVERIQSTGSEYINTPLILQDGYLLKMKVQYKSTGRWYNIGGYYDSGSDTRFYYGVSDNNNFGYGMGSNYSANLASVSIDTDYELEAKLWNGSQYFKVNDTTLDSRSMSFSTSAQYPIRIFAETHSGGASAQGPQRMYYCQLYNSSNVLSLDLIPCYRISDSVIGMYDLVNNVFYTNDGTGTFTKGPDVTHTKYIDRYYLNGELYGIKFGEEEKGWDMDKWTLAQTSSALSGTWRTGISMKPDGTRMYLSRDKYFYQCDLSTPFDISSYTQTSIFEWYQIEDIHFKPDGTKCYCLGGNPDASYIREYSLSTPWDITTATQTAEVQKETGQRGLYITPDGTTVFITKASYDQGIRIYTLSTPWSLSTIGTATNYSGHGVSIRFGNNGELMFIQEDNTSGNLTYKELSTPYDINSVVSTNTESVGSLRACGLWFNDKGTICVMVGGGDNTNYITKYTL